MDDTVRIPLPLEEREYVILCREDAEAYQLPAPTLVLTEKVATLRVQAGHDMSADERLAMIRQYGVPDMIQEEADPNDTKGVALLRPCLLSNREYCTKVIALLFPEAKIVKKDHGAINVAVVKQAVADFFTLAGSPNTRGLQTLSDILSANPI